MRAAPDPDLLTICTRDLSCLTVEEFFTLWAALGVLARKSAIATRDEATHA